MFHDIGRLDDLCPYCLTAFARRPKRKTTCKACGNAVYVRTRPLDENTVLLCESDLPALEKDWEEHYKIETAKPRQISPEWQARINHAMTAGPDPDPAIERLAHAGFSYIIAEIRRGIAPRDAKDTYVASLDEALRERVENRIWQLQVQSM